MKILSSADSRLAIPQCLLTASAATVVAAGCSTRNHNETAAREADALPSQAASTANWRVDESVLAAAGEPFETHGSYFAVNVPAAPVTALLAPLAKEFGEKLRSPNDKPHITVLTPGEAGALAKAGLSMRAIDAEFGRDVQAIPYEVECIAQGGSKKTANAHTYYIVVKSDGLRALREKILARAQSVAKGRAVGFDPKGFYPHITLGFTARDLHLESDGLRKDSSTCKFGIDLESKP